jgi:hypothetical protein
VGRAYYQGVSDNRLSENKKEPERSLSIFSNINLKVAIRKANLKTL